MIQGTDFIKILKTLKNHEVNFIIIGGISAVLHGAPVTTFDLDIIQSAGFFNNGHFSEPHDEGIQILFRGYPKLFTDVIPVPVHASFCDVQNFRNAP